MLCKTCKNEIIKKATKFFELDIEDKVTYPIHSQELQGMGVDTRIKTTRFKYFTKDLEEL